MPIENRRKDIKRAHEEMDKFIPPYCPNPECQHHRLGIDHATFYVHNGYKEIQRFPYCNKRYRCKSCRRIFSYSTFKLNYRDKLWGLYPQIWKYQEGSISKRAIGRILDVSEDCIRRRMKKLARFALLKHADLTKSITILEPMVYDGLENFSNSQYDPNNINHAIGKESLFTYDFNFAPLNRKGRMSPRQKAIKEALEKKHGKYPTDAIRTSSKKIFERLHDKANKNLLLWSDQHHQYRKAIEFDLAHLSINHQTISSKIARNFKNKLFAVNNFDMQIRKNAATFTRETISFAKHSIAMIDEFILQVVHRNYMRAKFYKKHKRDPESATTSPAMHLKLTEKILTFEEFFNLRVCKTQVKLNQDWEMFVVRVDPTSRRKIASYKGI